MSARVWVKVEIMKQLWRLWVVSCVVLTSCVHKATGPTEDLMDRTRPVEELYEDADGKMKRKEFKSAARAFATVVESYPYSKWATQAQVMEAYCRYQAHQYEDAIDGFTIFAKLHPHHKDVPYALYMIGLAHYERIAIVARDQEDTREALDAFQEVVNRFPTCEYAKDARFKIDFLQNHLAAKEMDVGRSYQKQKAFTAAINRFCKVILLYPTTEQRPEALFRLTECYAALNMREEFVVTYKVLKQNHKNSDWFRAAKVLYKTYIKVPPEGSKTNSKKTPAKKTGQKASEVAKKSEERSQQKLSVQKKAGDAIESK